MNPKRDPRGVPSGGQFAASAHDEADVSLSPSPVPSPGAGSRADMSVEEADEIAFRTENIESWKGLGDAPGEIIDDPSTLPIGSMVYVRGHGYMRKAVVYKVGKKNAVARFTTPGAYNEAQKHAVWATENYRNREQIGEQAAEQARTSYDYWVAASSPLDESYVGYDRQRTAERVAYAETWLSEHGTKDEYVEARRAASIREVEARYQVLQDRGLLAFTTMTNATVRAGGAKLVPPPASGV